MSRPRQPYLKEDFEDARNKHTLEKITEFIHSKRDQDSDIGPSVKELGLADFFEFVKKKAKTYTLCEFQQWVSKNINYYDTSASFVDRKRKNPLYKDK